MVTFTQLTASLFANRAYKCMRCHSADDASSAVDIETYENLVGPAALRTDVVVPGDPDASALYKSLATGMMPKNAAPLPPELLADVRRWILAGAPKD